MREKPIKLNELHKSRQECLSQKVSEYISAWFLLAGFFAVEMSLIESSLTSKILILTLIFPIVLIWNLDKSWQKNIKYVMLALVVLAVAIRPFGFIQGLLSFVNECIFAWNHKFGRYFSLYQVTENGFYVQLQFTFVINTIFYLVWEQCFRAGKMVYLALVEFLGLMIAIYFELSISSGLCAVFAVGIILCLMGKAFYGQEIKMAVCTVGSMLIIVFLLLFVTSNFQGSNYNAKVKEHILDKIEYLRYGEDTLLQGDMTKANHMIGSEDKETLQIQGESLEEMHLRGYVGANFDGTAWQTSDLSIYSGNNSGILDWLGEKGFIVPYQFGRFIKESDGIDEENEFTVKNVGAYRKYLYLPYSASDLSSKNGKICYDWQVISAGIFGKKSYQFKGAGSESSSETAIQKIIDNQEMPSQYIEAQGVYSNFVYENYLFVNQEEENTILESFYHNQDWSNADFYEITNQIRLVLQQLNRYEKSSEEIYDGTEDFIKWFARGNHICNSAEYATAAVLAYRVMGIPARYVEGYYLTEEKAKDNTEVTLTQADAHAWAEVYISDIGWLPMEVVPGNYYADYQIQDIASSPDSTVNVVEDEKNQLKGTTTDTLDTVKQNKPKPELPVQVIIHVMGILLFIVILFFIIWYMIQIQAVLRRKIFERKLLKSTDRTRQCRIIYERVWKIIEVLHWGGDFNFPYEYEEEFLEHIESIDAEEYRRFVSLIEKSVFSERGISDGEYRTVYLFLQRMTQEVYSKATMVQFIRLKYIYGI